MENNKTRIDGLCRHLLHVFCHPVNNMYQLFSCMDLFLLRCAIFSPSYFCGMREVQTIFWNMYTLGQRRAYRKMEVARVLSNQPCILFSRYRYLRTVLAVVELRVANCSSPADHGRLAVLLCRYLQMPAIPFLWGLHLSILAKRRRAWMELKVCQGCRRIRRVQERSEWATEPFRMPQYCMWASNGTQGRTISPVQAIAWGKTFPSLPKKKFRGSLAGKLAVIF